MKSIFKMQALWLAVLSLGLNACFNKVTPEEYDINYPVPNITSLSATTDTVGKTLTLRGTNFEKLNSVNFGTMKAEVVSSSATEIVVKIPRQATSGPVTVRNLYKKVGTSPQNFIPIYLYAKVTAWPTKVVRNSAIILKGENLDMVTQIDLSGIKLSIKGDPSNPGQLTIPTNGITLGDKVVMKLTASLGPFDPTASPEINVEAPSNLFDPVAPIVLFDFEDGVDPFVVADGQNPGHGINTGGVSKARGNNYLTVTKPGASSWVYQGEAVKNGPISLAEFHKPHLSFLVNTHGKKGYVQGEFLQGGTKWGLHFKPANSPFAYKFESSDWIWVSVELKTENLEKWGGDGTAFDAAGIIESFKLGFNIGDVNEDWEINVDQVMITDGMVKPFFTCFDFEDGTQNYNGNATAGINLSGIAPNNGDKYLTVKLAAATSWNWTGDINKTGPIDLSTLNDPWITFWVNTNGKKGFFQFETTENGTKWGANVDASDYFINTSGTWKRYSFRMANAGWGKWGGDGTELNLKGTLDYLKIGFTTGNVAGEDYEVNIDDVIISDGSMF